MTKHAGIKDHDAIKITLFAAALCVALLVYSALIYAQEYRFLQGVISIERVGHLVVNENQRINILEETVVKNKKDQIVPLKSLKVGKWVYVEGPLNMDGSIDAEIIYLLPGRISKKERHKYPFMKLPF
jgi:hypothetical protein